MILELCRIVPKEVSRAALCWKEPRRLECVQSGSRRCMDRTTLHVISPFTVRYVYFFDPSLPTPTSQAPAAVSYCTGRLFDELERLDSTVASRFGAW